MKNYKFLILIISFVGFGFVNTSYAQEVAPADTICFSVDKAQEIQQRMQTLTERDSLNKQIIIELENQVDLYKNRYELSQQQIELQKQECQLVKEKMKYTEIQQIRDQFKTRRWFYTVGGVAAGLLVGIFVSK